MNRNLTTTAAPALGVCSYESPRTKVVEVLSEGVLCVSGQFEEWKQEDLTW